MVIKFLNSCGARLPLLGVGTKGSHGYDLTAAMLHGLATLCVILLVDEARWLHLLELLAHINYNRQLTDEQCHHLSRGEKCRHTSSGSVTCA
jgi:hypothetical protein